MWQNRAVERARAGGLAKSHGENESCDLAEEVEMPSRCRKAPGIAGCSFGGAFPDLHSSSADAFLFCAGLELTLASMKLGEEAVVFCPSKLLPQAELVKLPRTESPLINLVVELQDFKQVREHSRSVPAPLTPSRRTSALLLRRSGCVPPSGTRRPCHRSARCFSRVSQRKPRRLRGPSLTAPPRLFPSRAQIRDLADDGGVIKRIIHKGKGIFPMDSPVEDANIVAHWRCGAVLLSEPETGSAADSRRIFRRPSG